MLSKWLTAEQVADHLQVSIATIWRYTRQGKLHAIKIGNHYRYPLDQVLEALQPKKDPVPTESHQRKMGYEEFSRLPEQPGLQLIDGILVKEPSPAYSHQACLGALYLTLCAHVLPRKLGAVVLAPFDVVLSDDTVLQPDILFVQRSRADLIQERGLFGPPDLAIEILSPSTRHYDEGRKRELYLQHGCEELWIVDPATKILTRHQADSHRWRIEQFGKDTSFGSQAIPTLTVSVREIFEINGN